jgi:hypothetical protein
MRPAIRPRAWPETDGFSQASPPDGICRHNLELSSYSGENRAMLSFQRFQNTKRISPKPARRMLGAAGSVHLSNVSSHPAWAAESRNNTREARFELSATAEKLGASDWLPAAHVPALAFRGTGSGMRGLPRWWWSRLDCQGRAVDLLIAMRPGRQTFSAPNLSSSVCSIHKGSATPLSRPS